MTKKQSKLNEEIIEILNEIKLKRVNEMKIVEEARKERIPKEKILEIFCYWQGYNRAIKNVETKIKLIKKKFK